ncbi:MAG: hypothetical protein M1319_04220, partial [Chloroflexi bacterium]|nr:hypothetical protein [Chloroflexota bacterium]
MRSTRPDWYSRVARRLRNGPLSSRSRRQEAISEALQSLAELGNPQENDPSPETERHTVAVKTEEFLTYPLLGREEEAIKALERLATMGADSGPASRRKALPGQRAFPRRRLESVAAGTPQSHIASLLTRYATHLVLLIIASLVVVGGGFRALSVQAAHSPGNQQINEAFIGSDVGLKDVAVDPSLNTQSGYLAADPSLDTQTATALPAASATPQVITRAEANPQPAMT